VGEEEKEGESQAAEAQINGAELGWTAVRKFFPWLSAPTNSRPGFYYELTVQLAGIADKNHDDVACSQDI
jgi:hypothetical protein